MIRCKVSIGILIGLVLLCFVSLRVLHTQCSRMAELTEAVIDCAHDGDLDGAFAALDALEENWYTFHHVSGVFVNGNELDSIQTILSGLRPLIAGENAEAFADLERLRVLFLCVYEEEVPGIWRVL